MTTLPMDKALNLSHLPSRQRVQRLFDKNVELENKLRKATHARIPSDPNAWQQIRENYETIILDDLGFSEQHEIEFKLWQLHHRKIEELRSHLSALRAPAVSTSTQNGKGPTRAGPDSTDKIRSQFKTFLSEAPAVSTSTQNGKGPTRAGPDRSAIIRSQFKAFLSEASGFYHDLMVKIRAKNGLELDFFPSDNGNQNLLKDGKSSTEVKQSLISCHRCLIYLGDLARYKGSYGETESKTREYAAASSYYSQASSLMPSSGNPHHQLAILATYSGDELVTIYRYFRSLSVDNPFTTARDNLTLAFEKNRQSYLKLVGESQASVKVVRVNMTGKGRGRGGTRGPKENAAAATTLVKEKASGVSETLKFFKVRFIRLNGILFTRTSLETFEEVFTSAREDLLLLLASGLNEEYNFGSDAAECSLVIIRMVAVLIFTVHNVKRESENQSYAEILQRSLLLKNAFAAIFDFMGNIFERCIQLSDPSTSYMLPGVLVFVEWLACHQDIACGSEDEEKQKGTRSSFWNLYISFANKLLSSSGFSMNEDEDETCFFNMSKYDEKETSNRLALFEDFELRGFLPLVPAQRILDFSRKNTFGSDGIKDKQARVHRIIAAGKALANVVQVGQLKIYFDSKGKKFTIGVEPPLSDDKLLSCSLETSSQGSMKVVEPMPELSMEEEEEDEVILFKPTVFDKPANGVSSKPISSDFLSNEANITEAGLGNHVGMFSASQNGVLLQNGLNTHQGVPSSFTNNTTQYMQPAQVNTSSYQGVSSSFTNITTQYMQPAQVNTLNWMVDKRVPEVKQLPNMSFVGNGFPVTHESQDRFGALQHVADNLLPFPYQTVNANYGNRYSIQLPETSLAPKFNSLSVNASALAPSGVKKNPVSRPVRYSGPPPGFSSVPSKQVDVSLQNSNPAVDDYSWLDGYKPSSTQPIAGFNSNINQQSHVYNPVNKNYNSLGEMVNFPFPGKQIQPLQVQGDKQNGWNEYQLSEQQMKLYQEQQQQQHEAGNQQFNALPEQYQGQSLWNGRFLV